MRDNPGLSVKNEAILSTLTIHKTTWLNVVLGIMTVAFKKIKELERYRRFDPIVLRSYLDPDIQLLQHLSGQKVNFARARLFSWKLQS